VSEDSSEEQKMDGEKSSNDEAGDKEVAGDKQVMDDILVKEETPLNMRRDKASGSADKIAARKCCQDRCLVVDDESANLVPL